MCGAQEWSYLRGGLSTLDRDYGIFNKIHHDIGTHVVHHLLPQIPHYNLQEATEAVKPVMGPYYRRGSSPLHPMTVGSCAPPLSGRKRTGPLPVAGLMRAPIG